MPSIADFTHYRIAKRPNQKWHLEGATDPSGPWHKLTKAEHRAVMPGFLQQYANTQKAEVDRIIHGDPVATDAPTSTHAYHDPPDAQQVINDPSTNCAEPV